MLTFSIKISCKYLDYNKEMFCAYEIDIYHVYQRATILTNDNCELNVAFSWIDFTTIDC